MELWIENGLTGNGLWHDAMGGLFREAGRGPKTEFVPAVDVIEDPEGYHFHFEIAGVAADSIEVQVEDDHLVVEAERKRPEWPKEAEVHRAERHYGAIRRSFILPEDADREGVHAAYRDGVLEVTLSKRPETKPVKVKVEYEN